MYETVYKLMYFEYDTPVCNLVMIWSTPSSRYAQVVARSALGGGMAALALLDDELAMLDVGDGWLSVWSR